MKRILMIVLSIGLLAFATEAWGQRITDSGFKTIAHIKSDGTIQDSSFKVIGHIRKDGLVQDASFKTIGHADDIPLAWAAYLFFSQ